MDDERPQKPPGMRLIHVGDSLLLNRKYVVGVSRHTTRGLYTHIKMVDGSVHELEDPDSVIWNRVIAAFSA